VGDIRITHPDVTTDSDWPELVPPRGGWHNTVAPLNGKTKPWRRTIVLAAFHRRRHSYAPTIATGHRRTDRDCILASVVPLSLFVLTGKRCQSTTRIIIISCLFNSDPYFLFLLSSSLFQRRSNGHLGAALRQGINADCPLHSFGLQVSQSASKNDRSHFF